MKTKKSITAYVILTAFFLSGCAGYSRNDLNQDLNANKSVLTTEGIKSGFDANLEALKPANIWSSLQTNWEAVSGDNFQKGLATNWAAIKNAFKPTDPKENCRIITEQLDSSNVTKSERAEILRGEGCI